MKEHVKRLSKLCFYHLRQLRVVRKSVTEQACVALVHAFVASRLDYCNSLLYGISDSLVNSLQSILRSAARLVLRKRKFEPITAAMRDKLHWLPVRQRIAYKLCTITYNCLHSTAPSYLSDMLASVDTVEARRRNRSATRHDLLVPRYRLARYGQRSFAVAAPATWNALPPELRDFNLGVATFRRHLKTFLFQQAYCL